MEKINIWKRITPWFFFLLAILFFFVPTMFPYPPYRIPFGEDFYFFMAWVFIFISVVTSYLFKKKNQQETQELKPRFGKIFIFLSFLGFLLFIVLPGFDCFMHPGERCVALLVTPGIFVFIFLPFFVARIITKN